MYLWGYFSRVKILLAAATLVFLTSMLAFSTTKTSAGNGNWGTVGTWSPSGVPGTGDSVVIATGHTVTLDVDARVGAVNIRGTLTYGGSNNRELVTTTSSGLSGDQIVSGTLTFVGNNNQKDTVGGNFTC